MKYRHISGSWLWIALVGVWLWTSACASGLHLAPAQPTYPYRGLNESTILGPR